MPREFKNRWTVPGDERHTNIPAIISKRQYEDNKDLMYAYNAYNYSTERIAKGDFIRMKEISLSYDFQIMDYISKDIQFIFETSGYQFIPNLRR